MSGKLYPIPAIHRSAGDGVEISGDKPSFSDTIFGFLDENYPLSADSSLEEREWGDEEEKEEEEDNSVSSQEKKAFWDEQEKLLQGILCRTSSVESRVRNATKEGLRQIDGTNKCNCCRPVGGHGCRDCLRRLIYNNLSSAGFNCSIRKSKWTSCPEIPSGEHTYLEVVERPGPSKGEVRVVIEVNLRAEFEMARASQDYNRLVNRLPEVYVGKPERLKNLIKILCGAAKKSMKEKKIHMGPWRKHKYMRAKWLGQSTELISITATTAVVGPPVVVQSPDRSAKPPRESMLTLSLLHKLPKTQCQAVAVI